jgi:hypothetical protein
MLADVYNADSLSTAAMRAHPDPVDIQPERVTAIERRQRQVLRWFGASTVKHARRLLQRRRAGLRGRLLCGAAAGPLIRLLPCWRREIDARPQSQRLMISEQQLFAAAVRLNLRRRTSRF